MLRARRLSTLDLTGGAPELNPHFRHLVHEARALGVRVIDRCNLTILNEPGYEDLAAFLAAEGVEVTASLPCYTKENVDRQRGDDVFESSILGLRKLNALGYGQPGSARVLNLVYNPLGPSLPPAQAPLEAAYQRELREHFGIEFNRLYTLANMPIARFGSTLVSQGKFAPYMALLRSAHNPDNLDGVMCRTLVSVDWRGHLHDCDFNQMLGFPLRLSRHAAGAPDRPLDRRPRGQSRSPSPTTATAVPPARVRAAAEPWLDGRRRRLAAAAALNVPPLRVARTAPRRVPR